MQSFTDHWWTQCVLLTVFGDFNSFGFILPDAQQDSDWMERLGDTALHQHVIHQLDLLPTGTQHHGYGLEGNTLTYAALYFTSQWEQGIYMSQFTTI